MNRSYCRDIDYKVARRIMGFYTVYHGVFGTVWAQDHSSIPGAWMYASVDLPVGNTWSDGLPKFSSSILAALLVVRQMNRQHFSVKRTFINVLKGYAPVAGIDPHSGYILGEDPLWWFLFDADIPAQICHAALRTADSDYIVTGKEKIRERPFHSLSRTHL